MALAYDFDIFEVIPDAGTSDPELDGFLTAAGFVSKTEAATVALFRDPRTAEALRRAPPALREYFVASGFGFNTYDSGAPAGRYPAKDEAARLAVIFRLTENASRHALPRPDDAPEGGEVFRLGAFLAELDRAQPIDMPEPPAVHVLGDDANARAEAGSAPRRRVPAIFETDPIINEPAAPAPEPPRRKFWQHRFFRLGAAATLVIFAMQLASGTALTVLASL
ncbi:hypothetical protein [Pseudotabrizicola algicola]|uniref:Uncharacterized protein n=1 Tax=Pseudotabrizicola algicola TaxID=2709381 RepID=A0A6B3RTV2_9RHOB|nr:hypothetical protein [Pseudotabrizicola algicola]NEX47375.1 hypothetical protein [Pseudotabrizicola algicola]